jgi:hypothetical protein
MAPTSTRQTKAGTKSKARTWRSRLTLAFMQTPSSCESIHGKSETTTMVYYIFGGPEFSAIGCVLKRQSFRETIFRHARTIGNSTLFGSTESRRNRHFNTGQALPLVFTRFLCPRISRGEYPKRPRDIDRARPRTPQIRDQEQSQITMQAHTIHVRDQFMSALSPYPQSRPQTGRIREQIAVSPVRRQTLVTDTHCPQTVHGPRLATSANSSRTGIVRETRSEGNCPRQHILVSIWSPSRFQVRIRIIPSYVLI